MYCEFLINKINDFYKNRIEVRKNKKALVINGKTGPSSITLVSNDYLSVANHLEILTAQEKEIRKKKDKVIMSAIYMTGDCLKTRFEEEMAEYLDYESAILCQSGWAANIGLIQAIATEGTPVYIDFYAHMSLWEGIRSAGAKPVPFLHNNCKHLEKMLKRHGQGIILIDSLYSSLGDIAPIAQIAELSQKYKCIYVVDESHSVGTHGYKGSGLVKELGLTEQVDFVTLSLAKTFAGRAGLLTCSKRFAGYFPYVSYPAIFSSALLDHEIAGLTATLKVIKESDDRRERLRKKSKILREGLRKMGYKVVSHSHIVSIEIGSEEDTETMRDALGEKDVFGSVFCFPAAPKNRALIRFSVNSEIPIESIHQILKACQEIQDSKISNNVKKIELTKCTIEFNSKSPINYYQEEDNLDDQKSIMSTK
jgi:CAI-1 autoinducer synthase